MQKYLFVSLGAVLGASARYWVGGWAAEHLGADFPYGTLIVNLSGSFLLGLFLTLTTQRFLIDPRLRLLIAVGFFGSYTTFSSYTNESLNLLLGGASWQGLLNLLGSALLGTLAALLGVWVGRML
ncbi:MAG: fluoride efflux transporter CrcB [Anaerolineae bacterium]|nr:MAG: fluoride efflux transporter CrcB [Anaerolineae bacterium]